MKTEVLPVPGAMAHRELFEKKSPLEDPIKFCLSSLTPSILTAALFYSHNTVLIKLRHEQMSPERPSPWPGRRVPPEGSPGGLGAGSLARNL